MSIFPDSRSFDLESKWRIPDADDRTRFYKGSYRFILDHFATCVFDGSKSDCSRFWLALILVYSWMGRGVLKEFSDAYGRYERVSPHFISVRGTGDIDSSSLAAIKEGCAISTIAASKFLHFLRPDRFAIWDSRVCFAITGKKDYSFVNDGKNLLAYQEWIREVKLDSRVRAEVTSYLGIDDEFSELRAKEFILFVSREARSLSSGEAS